MIPDGKDGFSVREELLRLSEPAFAGFQSGLIPSLPGESILGVRMPALRRLALQLRREQPEEAARFMAALPHRYLEENLLHCLLINALTELAEALRELGRFLPYVHSWAESDSLSPHAFRKHPEELYAGGSIQDWLQSENVYTRRFGMNVLMRFYLGEQFLPEMPEQVLFSLNRFYRDLRVDSSKDPAPRSDDYYLRMMTAWYFATAMARQEEVILPYLENRALDRWTHNKTIQKCVESYRIRPELKDTLRKLRVRK